MKFSNRIISMETTDRVILINSVSKRYSSCGARFGSVLSKNKM